MLDLVWLIPALPLAGFLVLVVLGRRFGEPLAGWLATLACGGSFVATLVVFAGLVGEHHEDRHFVQTLFTWLPVGGLSVDLGFLVYPLSVTMDAARTVVATFSNSAYSAGDKRRLMSSRSTCGRVTTDRS